jgi:hypothetical protein
MQQMSTGELGLYGDSCGGPLVRQGDVRLDG